jgi:TolB protein
MSRVLALLAVVMACALACIQASHITPQGRIGFQRFSKGDSQIYTVGSDGAGLRRVSQATGRSENPEFSPDARLIAYDHSSSVYIAAPDGSERRLLARDGYEPTWSPDGETLLFTRYRSGSDVAIFSIGKDGSKSRELTSGSTNLMPDWSPDGTRIAFVREPHLPQLWIMNADGSGKARVTSVQRYEVSSPEWSPDGTKLLFTTDNTYGRRCRFQSDLVVVRLDDRKVIRLTKSCRREEWGADWSPDGSEILYTAGTAQGFQIFVMRADGTDVRQLTHGPGRNDLPQWSSDGDRIAFISKRDGNREVYVMRSDGSAQTRLTTSRAIEFDLTW